MDRFDRIYRLYALFAGGRQARSATELQAELGCSRATLMRAIAELRDLLGVPLVWDAAARGYRIEGAAARSELPGLWFSADELQALLDSPHLAALRPLGFKLDGEKFPRLAAWFALGKITFMGARAAEYQIVAVSTNDDIFATIAEYVVISGTTFEVIISLTAGDDIHTSFTIKEIGDRST